MSGAKLTEQQKQALENTGYGLGGDIGGLERRTYYTPDGRRIRAIPGWRQFVRKDAAGKVIDSGTRDANLGKGWLLEPPKELKLYCRHCDRWHDTEAAIEACRTAQVQFIARATQKEHEEQTKVETAVADEMAALKRELAQMKAVLQTLKGDVTSGKILQSSTHGPVVAAGSQNGGTVTEGLQ